jgi:release factor glutamine methyltransferase
MRRFAADGSCERMADDALGRRLNGEPLAYILGEWEFYGLPLRISGDVLIPRTDTEVLAREGIRLAAGAGQGARAMDLCAGSGCVGIAIASNVKSCRVTFIEKSAPAIKLCKENIMKNALTRSAVCMQADVMRAPPVMLGRYALIVCNPPYIPTGDIDKLDGSVRLYEPRMALDGGEDGLDYFRSASRLWAPLLLEGGSMAFECGAGQSGDVTEIMASHGFTDTRVLTDSAGIERVVVGRLL